MMKFLVVHSFDTGITNISNVGVFEAETAQQAKERALKQWHLGLDSQRGAHAEPVESLADGWSFWT